MSNLWSPEEIRRIMTSNINQAERIRDLESALKTIHSFAFDDAHGLDDDDCLDRIRAMAYKALEPPQ